MEEQDKNENSKAKRTANPSSIKINAFEGFTAEQIINKYEEVLLSRERQFFELSQEIGKLTEKIQHLVKKKEKSKYNNDILKDIFIKNEQLLKQELSNKEIAFMKLTNLEYKYDDLQNKIDDIINKQNALADSTQKEKERMNKDKEEGKKLIDKTIYNEIKEVDKKKILDNELKNRIKKEIKNEDREKNKENKINENQISNNEIEIQKVENIKAIEKGKNEEFKINKKIEEKNNEDNLEKKNNSFYLARERLNKLKKEKTEKIKKLDLSELFASQTNNTKEENNSKNE